MKTILGTLLLLILCLVIGIVRIISAYKIHILKDYSKIQVKGIEAPKYPEKIAAKVALIELARGISFLVVILALVLIGFTDAILISCIVLVVITLIERKVVASGNSET